MARGYRGGARPKLLGKAVERKLVHILERAGWSVMRAPASGSGSPTPLPDIVAIKGGKILMFEVKYREKPRSIYVEAYKYERLRAYADNAGAELYLAVRVKGEDDFRILPWSDAEEVTIYGRRFYAFYKDKIDRAKTLTQLLASISA